MLFSLSMLTRDDISPLKNNYSLTVISSIGKNNDCVVCLPNRTWKILRIFRICTLLLHACFNPSSLLRNGESLFNIDDKKIIQNTLPYFPDQLFLLIQHCAVP